MANCEYSTVDSHGAELRCVERVTHKVETRGSMNSPYGDPVDVLRTHYYCQFHVHLDYRGATTDLRKAQLR